MKKIVYTLTILTTLFFASSCQSDLWNDDYRGGSGTTNGDGFSLRLSVPSGNISTRSTIAPEDGEDVVHSLHLLFFEATGAQTFRGHVTPNPSPYGDGTFDVSEMIHVRFDGTDDYSENLNHHTHYTILVVANVDDYIVNSFTPYTSVAAWLDSFKGMDLNAAINSRQLLVSAFHRGNENNQDRRNIYRNRLPMSAIVDKPANVEEVAVPLTRVVVRLDVELHSRVARTHRVVSASVWNVPRYASLWRTPATFPAHQIMRGYVQRVDANNSYFYDSKRGVHGFFGGLYTFENRQTRISHGDHHTTAVIIGLREVDENGNWVGDTEYHRVNVNLPFSGQNLQRNTVHNIRINHVLGPGTTGATVAEAEDRAYNRNNSQLQVSINDSDMDDRGVILIDGDNVLVLPTNRIVFPTEGGSRELTIFTHSPDGSARLGVSQLVTDPGITAVLTGHTLEVTATPSTDARQGFIEFEFGNLRARIEIVQASSFVEFLELNLNLDDIHMFSNAPAGEAMVTPNSIENFVRVTASGAWRATVFNDGFEFNDATAGLNFVSGTNNRTISGEPNGVFSLRTSTANLDDGTRYGFVLVSLESNPNINQVLVLRQAGTENVRIHTPDGEEVLEPWTYFDAFGNFMPTQGAQTRVYYITHGVTGLQPVELPAILEDFFYPILIESLSSTSTRLTITSRGNYNDVVGSRLFARVPIVSASGLTVGINVEQAHFNFTLSHADTPPAAADYEGGNSGAVTVTAQQVVGANTVIGSANWDVRNITTSFNYDLWPSGFTAPHVNTTPTTVSFFFPRTTLMSANQVLHPTGSYATLTVGITNTSVVYSGTRTFTQLRRPLLNMVIMSGGSVSSAVTSAGRTSTVGTFAVYANWAGPTAVIQDASTFVRHITWSGTATATTTNHSQAQMNDNRVLWGGYATVSLTHAWRNWDGGTVATAGPNSAAARQNFFGPGIHHAGQPYIVQTGRITTDFYGTSHTPPGDYLNVFGANNFHYDSPVGMRNWLDGTTQLRRRAPFNDLVPLEGRRVLFINAEQNFNSNTTSNRGFNAAFVQMGAPYNQFRAVDGNAQISGTQARRSMVGTTNPSGRFRVTGDTNTRLHQWLFETGPFTAQLNNGAGRDVLSEVSLAGYRNNISTWGLQNTAPLVDWPDTFIPIIHHPAGIGVMLGIDPVLRIVYVGQVCMFGTAWNNWDTNGGGGNGAHANWTDSRWSEANFAFTRNVAAWMAMVAQYGYEFLEQFVDSEGRILDRDGNPRIGRIN